MKNRVVMLVMVGMLVLGGCGANDTVEISTSVMESVSQESAQESAETESSEEKSSEEVQEEGFKFSVFSSTFDSSGYLDFYITQPVGYAKGRDVFNDYWTVSLASGHQTGIVAASNIKRGEEDVSGLENVFDRVIIQRSENGALSSMYGQNISFEETGYEFQEIHGYQVCKHTGNMSYTDGETVTQTKPYVGYSLESKGVPGAYLSFIIVDDGDREDVVADAEYMISTIKETVKQLNGKRVK